VPVLAGDTEETLAARVLAAEHRIYPAALGWLCAGRVRVLDGRAAVDGVPAASSALLNPLPCAPGLPKR
jgi:phosphoribosylglycinamide formyltransferase-1